MPDFLLELRSEEIPARMQAAARADLARLFGERMREAGVATGDVTVWSTPRRLALIARDLPLATAPTQAETRGPRTTAPAQALDGFLRKTGLAREQLVERDGMWFAIADTPGRATAHVLAEAIPAIVRAFPWPKSMRWGAASLASDAPRWVRPLSGIVAILGEDLVACAAAGVASGCVTLGHRFHHPGPITIGGAHDYADKLRLSHVIVDQDARAALIRDGARAAAAQAGLALVEDDGLVIENAGLTEWPVPLLGRFDPAFLEVPPEVIQLTARTNQKYFVCHDSGGKLADAFVCTANIAAADGGAGIVAGNRKVLAARLADARFFWEQDRRLTLEQHAEGLDRITFHAKLGTVADKAERVAKLARWLVEEGIVGAPASSPSPAWGGGPPQVVEGSPPPPADAETGGRPLHHPADGPPPQQAGEDRARLADLAEQAAKLCKADLVTQMVGEFPELQGVMGGYYARAEGLDPQVADAIRDHYKPVGQNDEVPTAPVTVAVALADKLDTLTAFFAIDERPTGSKDPFALRRAALGLIELIVETSLRGLLRFVFAESYRVFIDQFVTTRWCIGLNEFDLESWGARLQGDSAYLSSDHVGLVLIEEPSLNFSDNDEFGRPIWQHGELIDRRLIDFQVVGFVDCVNNLTEFMFDRLRERQKRTGLRADIVYSTLPIGERFNLWELDFSLIDDRPQRSGKRWYRKPNVQASDDVIKILNLSCELQAFVDTLDGANLLAGYKRAANILRKEAFTATAAPAAFSYTPEPAEAALIEAVDDAAPRAAEAVAREDFAGAMAALASLRAPIDAFFDQVTVNDADAAKRDARLALLDRFRAAVHNVADFSKIEG